MTLVKNLLFTAALTSLINLPGYAGTIGSPVGIIPSVVDGGGAAVETLDALLVCEEDTLGLAPEFCGAIAIASDLFVLGGGEALTSFHEVLGYDASAWTDFLPYDVNSESED